MNVLESYLLFQIAMLIGATLPIGSAASVPDATPILLAAAQPIANASLPAGPGVHQVNAQPHDALSAIAEFPTKIWVQSSLRDTVAHMWTRSPTFRRQCQQVQAAGAVQVQLRVDPAMVGSTQHYATCELRRYSGGALIARIFVAPFRLPEMIGHEMEHVCERLEGIRIEAEARNRNPGYYALGSTHVRYESERAIRIGRQVLAEVSLADVMTRTQ